MHKLVLALAALMLAACKGGGGTQERSAIQRLP
jgi:hypothetical protein